MWIKKYTCILLCLFGLHVYGQKPDSLSHTLAEVEISSSKSKPSFQDLTRISNRLFFNSLGDLLAAQGQFFARNYGPGSLASLTFRGGNANQTQVLWNGIQVNNAMTGQSDLSLLPPNFSKMEVHSGGSDGINGAILVGSAPEEQSSASLLMGYGSFNTQHVGLKSDFKIGKSRAAVQFYRNSSSNAFRVENADNQLYFHRNGAFEKQGFMADFLSKKSEALQFSSGVWYQNATRGIPEANLVVAANARQKDEMLRAHSSIEIKKSSFSLKSSIGATYDRIQYQNPLLSIASDAKVLGTQFSNEAEKNFFGFGKLKALCFVALHQAAIQNYALSNPVQKRIKIQLAWKKEFKNSEIQLSNRLEYFKSTSLKNQFQNLPEIWVKTKLFGKLILTGSVRKVFRPQTFNELYWNPGGNPNLQPETGWNKEIKFQFSDRFSRNSIHSELTFFRNNSKNRILWMPSAHNGVWSPVNAQSVLAKGLEMLFSYKYFSGFGLFETAFSHTYTKAENAAAISDNPNTINKQIIYTPEHISNISIKYLYHRFSVCYQQQFIGRNYTTWDNSEYLSAYTISNIQLNHGFKLRNQQNLIHVSFNLDNIWNRTYQTMPGYYMPGRNYTFGLIYKLDY